jgi:ABC-2 type transport system permease protein
MPPNIQKYFAIFQISFSHSLRNYKALIGLSIFLITCLIIFAHLWQIAAAKAGVTYFRPEQLLWYIAFNEWVLISIPSIQEDMEQDLHSGRLAYLLPRPISYLGSTFSEAAGNFSANLLVLGGGTFIFTWLQSGELPFHFTGLTVAIILGFIAGLIAILFQMMIGLSAFWLQEVTPFFWIWEKLLFMLGGLILPLAAYPQWMQKLASFTPFPAILGYRSALALNYSLHDVLMLTLILVGWSLVGLIGLTFIFRKGLRILNVEGG